MCNLTKYNTEHSYHLKALIIFIGLIAGVLFVGAIFIAYPYPYVSREADSIHIFSSLSILTDHTVAHNDHPALTLKLAGTLPVTLGTAFIMLKDFSTPENALFQKLAAQKKAGIEPVEIIREPLIQKVIEDMPFFQQLFLGLVGLTFVCVLVILIWTLYQKSKQNRSFIVVLSGIALMIPPTLGHSVGVTTDIYAFSLGILFAVSLLWKRNFRNDALTSLFFCLMVYTKITFAPLVLLIFAVEQKSISRILKGTFIWLLAIYFLFWDFNQLLDFVGFLVLPAIRNNPGSLNLAEVLEFYLNLLLRHPVQSFYFLLFVLLAVFLALKRGFRIKGILGLTAIIIVVAVTILRQYKAEVYMWPVYAAGLLLTASFFQAYPRYTHLLGTIFTILLIISAGLLYKDVTNLRKRRIERLQFRYEYEKTIIQSSSGTFLESELGPLSLGNSYRMANSYAKNEYTSYLEEYYKKRFGLKNLYHLQWQKNRDPIVKQYFSGQAVNNLEWVPNEGCYLAIPAGSEDIFQQQFPKLDILLVKTIPVCNTASACNVDSVNIWNIAHKIDRLNTAKNKSK